MYKGGAKNMKLTLKACRVIVNASVKEEAKAVGVSEDSIYKWESGEYAPKLRHVVKLLEFFNSKGFNISFNDINFLP